jgi:hypothetical protein
MSLVEDLNQCNSFVAMEMLVALLSKQDVYLRDVQMLLENFVNPLYA